MKSLMSLWSTLAHECASICNTSANRDVKTVAVRVEHEGFSFLAITLPDFGKAVLHWLDQGQVTIHPSFFHDRGRGIPAFLSGFLSQVFNTVDGRLLDEPNVDAIRSVLQLTLLFGKVEHRCTPQRERAAMKAFVECEQEVRRNDAALTVANRLDFERVSSLLFRRIFTIADRKVFEGDLLPKHGPGATADGLTGNGKFRQTTWPARLDKYFPSSQYLLSSFSYNELLDSINLLEPGEERPVKVTPVPKTLKTPRIIAIEPTAMQYTQQALLPLFVELIERDFLLGSFVGFTDQGPNQALAREGSLTGRLATLDLSDASDRVSNQLVRLLMSHHRHLHDAVQACRSRKADVPGESVIRLAKFASMGSALCFPVEAMVFLTVVMIGIERTSNRPLTRRSLRGLRGRVRIYGDDIIVPADCVSSVTETLEAFGAKVNLSKSFGAGKFRESCGKEYYDGTDVTIVRFRRRFPTRLTDAQEAKSLVEFRNQLYKHGYWSTVQWLDGRLVALLKHFPVVDETATSTLGRHSFLPYKTERLHRRFHSPLVKGYRVVAKPPSDKLDGHSALLKILLQKEAVRRRVPIPVGVDLSRITPVVQLNEDNLERSGRPKTVRIKLGWCPPF